MLGLFKRVYLDLHYYLFPLHRLRRSGADIGSNVFWGQDVKVELENAHLLKIEAGVTVSAHCSFILHDSSLHNVAGFDLLYGRIILKKNSYIGAHTVLLPGTEVGTGSIVGATALVKGRLKAHSVYIGQPARWYCSVKTLTKRWQQRRQRARRAGRSPVTPFFSKQPLGWSQTTSS
jgi:maltose O-acetyltransferase